jgi:hypothetical protein
MMMMMIFTSVPVTSRRQYTNREGAGRCLMKKAHRNLGVKIERRQRAETSHSNSTPNRCRQPKLRLPRRPRLYSPR